MKLMNRIKSIRSILTIWYSSLLLGAFILFAASTYFYLQHMLESQLDRNLLEEVQWIRDIIEVERERFVQSGSILSLSEDVQERLASHFSATPRKFTVLLTVSTGDILFRSETGVGRKLPVPRMNMPLPELETISSEGQELRVATRIVSPFILQVAYPVSSTSTTLDHLLTIFAILIPVMLFVAFSSGWVMAGIVLQPIDDIGSLAQNITARNLNRRIPEREVKDELGRLIDIMNGMIARFQTSFEDIRTFSMSVAHELKTPLAILKGESEIALSKPLTDEETKELITTYLEETSRMARIVDDLLLLAKADAGQVPIEFERVNVQQLVEELYDDAQLLASGKNLKIDLVCSEPAVVSGDRLRLRQLFRILLTNAVQYTDSGGTIRLGCKRDGNRVVVSVEDTGIGIPVESIDRIFERFYRVDQARTRAKGGSGLGLSIAKWIVESHRGTVHIQSEPGKGSRFDVSLPLGDTPIS
jgi:heavy metal sensor kinase